MIEWHGPVPDENHLAGRWGYGIDAIVLHTMVCWIAQAESRFKNPASVVSAHYGIRLYDVPSWQWVDDADTAYHAGNWMFNLTSLGFEHEDGGDFNGVRPDVLYARSAARVREKALKYGIPLVRGSNGGPGIYDHRDVSDKPTACPDGLDTDRIIREAAAGVATSPNAAILGDSAVFGTPADAQADAAVWAQIYRDLAPTVRVRAELAFAQALKETGSFTFLGRAQRDWNNPCGLGVGALAIPGVPNSADCRFPTKEAGARAHLGHLIAYAGAVGSAHVPGFCDVDPRHVAHRGLSQATDLDGKWAVPGAGYGASLLVLVSRVEAAAPPPPAPVDPADAAFLERYNRLVLPDLRRVFEGTDAGGSWDNGGLKGVVNTHQHDAAGARTSGPKRP